MRGDRDQRIAPPPLRLERLVGPAPLEPEHVRAEHAARGQRLSQPRLHRAQVLADHDRPGRHRSGRERAERALNVVVHVRALGGRHPGRYPPQPRQPHDVVDPQPARAALETATALAVAVLVIGHPPQRRVEQLRQRPVPGRRQRPRVVRRQRPVLPALVERVRRRADAEPAGEELLAGPRVRAAGVRADREVGDDADRHARPSRAAACAAATWSATSHWTQAWNSACAARSPRRTSASAAARVAQPGRPGPVVGAVHLGQRAPGRPVLECPPVPGAERVERRLPLVGQRHLPQHFQRLALGRPDGVPVDERRRSARRQKRCGQER